MKHHPKSNNGVFSKKQKKASRMMMSSRFMGQSKASGLDIPAMLPSGGVLAAIGALLFGRVGRQRRP